MRCRGRYWIAWGNPMATNVEWSQAYVRQANADFKMFQTFGEIALLDYSIEIEECHKLQFLQMACEKLVKAHLCEEGTDPALLQKSHAYVAGSLPVVLLQTAHALKFSGRNA
jgi:hypothetical protein